MKTLAVSVPLSLCSVIVVAAMFGASADPVETATGLLDVTRYGAIPDDAADDTAAIQKLLDRFSFDPDRNPSPDRGGLFFPPGEYRISRTLRVLGDPGTGFILRGCSGRARGPWGSTLGWYGPEGGTLLHLDGVNGTTIKDLDFLGRSKAQYLIHFDSHSHRPAAGRPAGSSGIVCDSIVCGGNLTASGACIAFGHRDSSTMQVSEFAIRDSILNASGAEASAVWLNGGNVKNYSFVNCGIVYGRYGLKQAGWSGFLLVQACSFAARECDIWIGTSGGLIQACGSEGARQFIYGATGANAGLLSVVNCYWHGACQEDDIVIQTTHSLYLRHNSFYNGRTADSPPRIAGGYLLPEDPTAASIVSLQNHYVQARGDYPPLVDSQGNSLFAMEGPYAGKKPRVWTRFDAGGVGGDLVSFPTIDLADGDDR